MPHSKKTVYEGRAVSRDYAETMATHHSALGERTGGTSGRMNDYSCYRNTGGAPVYFEWVEDYSEARGDAEMRTIILPRQFRFYTTVKDAS